MWLAVPPYGTFGAIKSVFNGWQFVIFQLLVLQKGHQLDNWAISVLFPIMFAVWIIASTLAL